MNIFDILGPVMVGPSSSHTAGAVKIGLISRKLLGQPVADAQIYLHGSFLATGQGHGTDRALVAGLLGMKPDDIRIPHSFEHAKEEGLTFNFHSILLKDVHPNSVKLVIQGVNGRELEIIGSSIGGGRITICSIDGLDANFSGESPTLIVHNEDQPGHVSSVTAMLANQGINIATMQLYRDIRGGNAVMVIEVDHEIPQEALDWVANQEGINKVTYLSLSESF